MKNEIAFIRHGVFSQNVVVCERVSVESQLVDVGTDGESHQSAPAPVDELHAQARPETPRMPGALAGEAPGDSLGSSSW